MLCKSIVLVVIANMHYKSFSECKSALQIFVLMLRKFVMHLYEYDTFAFHIGTLPNWYISPLPHANTSPFSVIREKKFESVFSFSRNSITNSLRHNSSPCHDAHQIVTCENALSSWALLQCTASMLTEAGILHAAHEDHKKTKLCTNDLFFLHIRQRKVGVAGAVEVRDAVSREGLFWDFHRGRKLAVRVRLGYVHAGKRLPAPRVHLVVTFIPGAPVLLPAPNVRNLLAAQFHQLGQGLDDVRLLLTKTCGRLDLGLPRI